MSNYDITMFTTLVNRKREDYVYVNGVNQSTLQKNKALFEMCGQFHKIFNCIPGGQWVNAGLQLSSSDLPSRWLPPSSTKDKQEVLQTGHGLAISVSPHHKTNPLRRQQIIVIVASTVGSCGTGYNITWYCMQQIKNKGRMKFRHLYHTWVWNRGICMCVIVRPRSHMLIVLKKVIPDSTRYDFA